MSLIRKIVCVLGLGVALAACGHKPAMPLTAHMPSLMDTQQQDRMLYAEGVYVVRMGDTQSFFVSLDKLFKPNEDVLMHNAMALQHIARVLSEPAYKEAIVKVVVYGEGIQKASRTRQLAERRAQHVVGFLWHHGVSAWRLYPQVSSSSLHANKTAGLHHLVEITFNPHVTRKNCCKDLKHFIKESRWDVPR